MRLQAIKLAGFKSFVDQTTVPFSTNLCGVVGPNGCGKSNIIDAVRWVMGEISAKNLRGESMTDVIFNGATTRKPVGQAGIELLFDNSAGRLTGEYAGYTEISIKRQVSRDGQSSYFLNNVKCRRKDITDIFLGTGLGPRSYSIIEQGMISQLIEAKPEELRVYLEEAAGISKYKERRKETERRISHTRDNLDRLRDLREELERQIQHLERQAKAAERYKALKEEERTLQAQVLALRWQKLKANAESKKAQIDHLETELQAKIADQRRLEAEIVGKRADAQQVIDQSSEVQRQFYDLGTEIARIEESIQYQSERAQALNEDIKAGEEELTETRARLTTDQAELSRLTAELEALGPRIEAVTAAQATSSEALAAAEQALRAAERDWESFARAQSEARQTGEIAQSKISMLEDSIGRLTGRINQLKIDQSQLEQQSAEQELKPLEAMLETQQAQVQRIESELAEITKQMSVVREDNDSLTKRLDERRRDAQHLGGRLASLEALQQAALGQGGEEQAFLEDLGLSALPRVGERLKVQAGWEVAVEAVLGDTLQAIIADDVLAHVPAISTLTAGAAALVSASPSGSQEPSSTSGTTLDSVVTADAAIAAWLKPIRLAEDLNDAISIAAQLSDTESVITRDGIWLGRHWVRVSQKVDETAGVVRRQQELEALDREVAGVNASVVELEAELEGGQQQLVVLEQERDETQRRLTEQQRSFGETRARLTARRIQSEQIAAELERAKKEISASQIQLDEDDSRVREARGALTGAMDQMADLEAQRVDRETQLQVLAEQLEAAKQVAAEDQSAGFEASMLQQNLQTQISGANALMARLTERETQLVQRIEEQRSTRDELEAPSQQLRADLNQKLAARQGIEEQLTALRQRQSEIEAGVSTLEQQRASAESGVEDVRAGLESQRLDYQGIDVRLGTITEQLAEQQVELQSVIEGLPEGADESTWEASLTTVGNRIQRLGAINLAAIDEFKVQSERKAYLDAQNEDLEKALDTLLQAIRKIDVETRTRFKETFDLVNAKLQQLFPKLFGGGHAYLEMTGEDLLDTGVGLMARPPGKRNASIHLLSGGEKALTAIALVFSIFNLNPAPFCMLDEVDAPLDDANVGRFCEMVKEMSRTVQFIYITHNKVTMEMAEQLMGVTMHEAGVSRMVTVDVDEAVALSAV